MELPEIITLSWVQDLCSPPRPGRRFSRLGYLVIVAPDKFNAAQAELADGAIDLVFTAKRVHTPSLSRATHITRWRRLRKSFYRNTGRSSTGGAVTPFYRPRDVR